MHREVGYSILNLSRLEAQLSKLLGNCMDIVFRQHKRCCFVRRVKYTGLQNNEMKTCELKKEIASPLLHGIFHKIA